MFLQTNCMLNSEMFPSKKLETHKNSCNSDWWNQILSDCPYGTSLKNSFQICCHVSKKFSTSLEPSKSPPQEFVESLNLTLVGREYIRFLRNCMIFLQWCTVSFLIFELWFAYINRAAEARNRIRLTRLRYQNNRVRSRQKRSLS